jgi:hypothetical protein
VDISDTDIEDEMEVESELVADDELPALAHF